MATAAGVLLGLAPLPLLGGLLVWAAVFAWRRTSRLAGLSAAAVLPVLVLLLAPEQIWATLLLCLAVFGRHIPNIRRMLDGTEGARQRGESPEGYMTDSST